MRSWKVETTGAEVGVIVGRGTTPVKVERGGMSEDDGIASGLRMELGMASFPAMTGSLVGMSGLATSSFGRLDLSSAILASNSVMEAMMVAVRAACSSERWRSAASAASMKACCPEGVSDWKDKSSTAGGVPVMVERFGKMEGMKGC